VGKEAKHRRFKTLAILGTKYLMTGPVYPKSLENLGMSSEIPDAKDREEIDRIIFKELVNGIFLEESRHYFNEVISKLAERGCEAVVLGCTEIPLIVDPKDCPLPTLDSTRLLARAALGFSLDQS
jgi:aspartate racemase